MKVSQTILIHLKLIPAVALLRRISSWSTCPVENDKCIKEIASLMGSWKQILMKFGKILLHLVEIPWCDEVNEITFLHQQDLSSISYSDKLLFNNANIFWATGLPDNLFWHMNYFKLFFFSSNHTLNGYITFSFSFEIQVWVMLIFLQSTLACTSFFSEAFFCCNIHSAILHNESLDFRYELNGYPLVMHSYHRPSSHWW